MPHSNRDLLQPPGEITAGLSAAHVINHVSFLTHTQNLEKKPLAGPKPLNSASHKVDGGNFDSWQHP